MTKSDYLVDWTDTNTFSTYLMPAHGSNISLNHRQVQECKWDNTEIQHQSFNHPELDKRQANHLDTVDR